MSVYNITTILSVSAPYLGMLCNNEDVKKHITVPLLNIIKKFIEKLKNNTDSNENTNIDTQNISITNITNINNIVSNKTNLAFDNSCKYVYIKNYIWINEVGMIKGHIDKLVIEKHNLINNE
jgi:hypothetical protein